MLVVFLVVTGGAAIDISRVINAREKLSYAVDAAALSLAVQMSGKTMTDREIRAHLEGSFDANIRDDGWKARAIENIAYTVNSDEGWIEVSSTSRLENYFIGFAGYGLDSIGPDAFDFGVRGRVAYAQQNIEIALALDITGSMYGYPMTQLKKATNDLITELIPEGTRSGSTKVRIGLAPYADSVNAELIPKLLSADDRGYGYWPKRCLSDRHPMFMFEEFSTAGNGNSWFLRGAGAVYWGRWRDNEPTNLGCPWSSPIRPITSDRRELLTAVDRLQAGGGTSGHLGMNFAWRLLSPEWQNVFPPQSAPAPYNGSTIKIAVLMTDGDFNTAYSLMTEKGKCVWPDYRANCKSGPMYDWKWTYHLADGWDSPSYVRARRYCDIMKAKGIQIWTIFFDNNVRSNNPERIMAYCAGNEGEYIKVDDAARLSAAYTSIAKKIQAIYLSK